MSCFHRAVYVIFVLFITFLNFFIRFLKFSFLCYIYVKLLINYLVLDIFFKRRANVCGVCCTYLYTSGFIC